MRMVFRRVKLLFDLVQFEHTIFALPFAYAGAILGARGMPPLEALVWMTLAMVGARTCGMVANRWVDEPWDRKNPRMQNRPLIDGRVSHRSALGLGVGGAAVFLLAASQLPPICLRLTPIALLLLGGYAYLKRFTWLSHAGIGLVLAVSPVGGWLAVGRGWAVSIFLLAGAVACWVAGFDILYSLQDVEFDRRENLHSFPADWGIPAGLFASRLLHGSTLLLLAGLGWIEHLGRLYWMGLLAALGLLVWEHRLIAREGLRKIQMAFFVLNGWVSVVFMAAVFFSV